MDSPEAQAASGSFDRASLGLSSVDASLDTEEEFDPLGFVERVVLVRAARPCPLAARPLPLCLPRLTRHAPPPPPSRSPPFR